MLEKPFESLGVFFAQVAFIAWLLVAPGSSSALALLFVHRFLHLHEQLAELLVHLVRLLGDLGEVDLDLCDGRERLQDRQRCLGVRKLGEDVRHLAKQARAAQPALAGDAQQNAVETADVAVLEDLRVRRA